MISISKDEEPEEVKRWKELNPGGDFSILDAATKVALQVSLMKEQGYVCCFCGIYIGVVLPDGTVVPAQVGVRPHYRGARVAHITPQSIAPLRTIDYSNLCISCPGQDGRPTSERCHCDRAQGNSSLPIHPLMQDCISFFSFNDDGTVSPSKTKSKQEQADAKLTIETLNLCAKRLQTKRKEAIDGAFELIADEGYEVVTTRLKQKQQGKFTEFYFVVLSNLAVDGYC